MMKKIWIVLALVVGAALPAFAQVPNDRATIDALLSTGQYDLKTHAGQSVFIDDAVAVLHAKDARWGHLRKSPGQTNIHLHAEDAALYLNTAGLSVAVDFINGAGGSNPSIGWNVDAPRYSPSDWWDPTTHTSTPIPVPLPPVCPVCPPSIAIPAYAGDEAFDAVAIMLFSDYIEGGQPPNIGMGRWYGRTIYDWIAGNTKTLNESIAKHRAEWRAALGLPRLP
jgi:hypothetical protein